MTKEEQSRIIIISGPSGTGKSTIIKLLMERHTSSLEFSISTTTRTIRPKETHGIHYYFVTIPQFKTKIENDDFLEYAQVHNNYYGTSKQAVYNSLTKSSDMRCILDIDVQGAIAIRKIYPYAKRIFILPPSVKELGKRLKERGDTSEEDIKLRLENSLKELSYIPYYNYFVVNSTPLNTVKEIERHIYE